LGNFTTQQNNLNSDFLNTNTLIDTINNLGELGWKSFLIDTNDDSLFYGIAKNGGVQQEIEIVKEGFNSTWDFALGTNYEDILYFGGSIKVNQYEFMYRKRIVESDILDSISNFKRFDYTSTYNSVGTGVGYTLGMIVKPQKYWRIGVGFTGKTNYNLTINTNHILNDVDLTDTGNISLLKRYDFTELERKSIVSRAPQVTVGNYYQFKKIGFITTDFEYNFMSTINSNLKNTFRLSNGFEIRKNDLRFRAGGGIKNSISNLQIIPFWSLGVGIRKKAYFIDLAFNRTSSHQNFNIYELQNNTNTELNLKRGLSIFSFTFGTKF